jgi:hypothetical protein
MNSFTYNNYTFYVDDFIYKRIYWGNQLVTDKNTIFTICKLLPLKNQNNYYVYAKLNDGSLFRIFENETFFVEHYIPFTFCCFF